MFNNVTAENHLCYQDLIQDQLLWQPGELVHIKVKQWNTVFLNIYVLRWRSAGDTAQSAA